MAPSSSGFNLKAGRKVGRRFVIERQLGRGTEGEVYAIRELDTGVRRAAKLHYPDMDRQGKRAVKHAQRLESLRPCPIVLQYHHTEVLRVGKEKVHALISDLCDGQQLEQWIWAHPGGRLQPYLALHVLYNLVRGLECIHDAGQYHADVHSQNILIKARGVRFDLKLIDFFEWGRTTRSKQKQDIRDTIAVFYECLGGKPFYRRQSPEIKYIISGMRRQLMLERFPTITALRRHLESFEWETMVS